MVVSFVLCVIGEQWRDSWLLNTSSNLFVVVHCTYQHVPCLVAIVTAPMYTTVYTTHMPCPVALLTIPCTRNKTRKLNVFHIPYVVAIVTVSM